MLIAAVTVSSSRQYADGVLRADEDQAARLLGPILIRAGSNGSRSKMELESLWMLIAAVTVSPSGQYADGVLKAAENEAACSLGPILIRAGSNGSRSKMELESLWMLIAAVTVSPSGQYADGVLKAAEDQAARLLGPILIRAGIEWLS